MMRVKQGILAAALTCLMGTSAAWASDVQGRVLCAGTGTGLEGVRVIFTFNEFTYEAMTDGDGAFALHVGYAFQTYGVSLDLTAVGGPGEISMGTVYIGYGTVQSPFVLPPFEVEVSGCVPPPPTTADCSPGYYKNHPETWCDPCFAGEGCDFLLGQLSAGGPGSAAVREAAKALIDACFGTTEASPCTDD